MKKSITFTIECGEITCASSPGKFCQFLRIDLKEHGRCHLFGAVYDLGGWLQRHPDCLSQEKRLIEGLGKN